MVFSKQYLTHVVHYNLKADVQIVLKWNPSLILWVGDIQDGSVLRDDENT